MAGGKDLRLFVAIYPPEGGKEGQVGARDWLRTLRKLDPPLANHRPTPPEQVHLTLQFIGDTPAADLNSVIESVERSASGIGPFSLTPVRFMSLPKRGRPRLVALETDAPPGLLELQRRLAQRLARNARPHPGDKYLPHFTLCRFTHGAKPSDVDLPVNQPPFSVDKIILVRSVLRPEGAEHRPLREFPLSG
jgi:2'-5' RNA ligase